MNAIATLPTPATTGARMNALVPNNIGEALQLAEVMAKANLIPDHLRGKPGDCLLIAGKGHESYQEFADTVIPFDDRQVVRELIGIKTLKRA